LGVDELLGSTLTRRTTGLTESRTNWSNKKPDKLWSNKKARAVIFTQVNHTFFSRFFLDSSRILCARSPTVFFVLWKNVVSESVFLRGHHCDQRRDNCRLHHNAQE
jgi:hypothetical protein